MIKNKLIKSLSLLLSVSFVANSSTVGMKRKFNNPQGKSNHMSNVRRKSSIYDKISGNIELLLECCKEKYRDSADIFNSVLGEVRKENCYIGIDGKKHSIIIRDKENTNVKIWLDNKSDLFLLWEAKSWRFSYHFDSRVVFDYVKSIIKRIEFLCEQRDKQKKLERDKQKKLEADAIKKKQYIFRDFTKRKKTKHYAASGAKNYNEGIVNKKGLLGIKNSNSNSSRNKIQNGNSHGMMKNNKNQMKTNTKKEDRVNLREIFRQRKSPKLNIKDNPSAKNSQKKHSFKPKPKNKSKVQTKKVKN